MRIAIIGTRGIPNHYGGFEQCAEYLAFGLAKRGFQVVVYNSHTHPYKSKEWNGVEIVHCYDPENMLGTAGQFIYDLNCILDSRKRNLDIILQLGYTSNSLWGMLLPSKAVITTNMDGLEWKRTKYSKPVKSFLLYAEKLGIKHSDHLIADSLGIQEYLFEKYGKKSTFIPYGAHLFENPDLSVLDNYQLKVFQYNLLIARLEPENSIETILDGAVLAESNLTFLVIGKHTTTFGEYLKKKFEQHNNIKFIGGIYDINQLNNLRYFSQLYFHGHTVGGTNPSLLEAMASNSLICANDNPFNKYILGDDALYFTNSTDVRDVVKKADKTDNKSARMLSNNHQKIEEKYSWKSIVDQYEEHFKAIAKRK
ncbi:glycosyltransferase family 1 protein [Inquilinus sp. KBS0705]|nr:glycosyltransferase family 1 protein [Inquilinus sp. KBS0705]